MAFISSTWSVNHMILTDLNNSSILLFNCPKQICIIATNSIFWPCCYFAIFCLFAILCYLAIFCLFAILCHFLATSAKRQLWYIIEFSGKAVFNTWSSCRGCQSGSFFGHNISDANPVMANSFDGDHEISSEDSDEDSINLEGFLSFLIRGFQLTSIFQMQLTSLSA